MAEGDTRFGCLKIVNSNRLALARTAADERCIHSLCSETIMGSFISGLIGGVIAWFGTALIGQPIWAFLNLRVETSRVLHLSAHEHWRAVHNEIAGGDNKHRDDLIRCAVQLQTFVATQSIASVVMRSIPFQGRLDLLGASYLLLELAGANAGSNAGDGLRSAIASKLWMKAPPKR